MNTIDMSYRDFDHLELLAERSYALVRILRSLYDNPYAFKGFSSETDLATVLEMLEEWIGNITDYLHQRDCRFDENFEDDDADSQDEE